jgi:hypothetical protein
VLNRIIGSHILKNHQSELLGEKSNLKALHNDKNFKKPLTFFIGDDAYYFCLADKSCIKKEILADNHFKGKADAHRDAILKLREEYPITGEQPDIQTPTQSASSFLTEKERKTLQDFLVQCVLSDDIGLSTKDKKIFEKLGCILDPEALKEMYPHLFEDKKDEETEEHEETEETLEALEAPPMETDEEVLPLTLPKPMTKEEVFHHIMTEKDIKALSTSITSGKTIEVPELKLFQNTSSFRRPTDLQLMAATRPHKDEAPMKLIQNTKQKRIPKQVPDS